MSVLFLVESTALLLLALLLCERCHEPSRRAAIGFAAMAALPLLALVQLTDFGWHPLTRQVTLSLDSTPATAAAMSTPSISPWIVLWIAYGVVAVWRLLQWTCAQWRMRRWLREARPCDAPQWQRQSRLIAGRHGVPVLVHAAAGSPFLLGWRRPRVVIPAYLEHCSEARARLVLLHECSHWQARDPLRMLVVDLICCLLWFQPLLQRVRRGFSADIELACDDQVLRAGSDAHDYAETIALCATQQRLQGAALVGMAMQRSQLVQRVTRILDASEASNPAGLRWPLLVMCVAGVLLLGVNFSPRVEALVMASSPADVSIEVAPPTHEAADIPAITWPQRVTEKPSTATVQPVAPTALREEASQRPAKADAVPAAVPVTPTTPASRIDSARLQQSISSVAVIDAQRYAQEHAGEPLLDNPATPNRFEQGMERSRAERSARREKVVRRVMEGLMGTIPLN